MGFLTIFGLNSWEYNILGRKSFSIPISSRMQPIFSRCFSVSCFKSSTLIHLQLVFGQDDRYGFNFILSHVDTMLSSTLSVENAVFFQCIFLSPSLNIKWLQLCILMFGSSVFFHQPFLLLPSPYFFNCYDSVMHFESRLGVLILSAFFLLRIVWFSRILQHMISIATHTILLYFHMKLRYFSSFL